MEKQQWIEPEINELGVENTEYGTKVTSHVDATFNDTSGDVFFSFS